MTDFTIKVFSDANDQIAPTEVEIVGSQLKILAEQFPIMDADPIFRTKRSSDLVVFDSGSNDLNQESKDAVDILFEALSFVIWEDDTVKSQHNRRDSATKEIAREHVKLVFVFEEEGQMVVPVPSIKQITRGAANAPLKLPKVYDQFISDNSITQLIEQMKTNSNGGANNVFSAFTKSQWGEVEAVLREAAKVMRDKAKIEPNKSKTFYAQLGDYSMRQCAS